MTLLVSVVIATRNREPLLAQTLDALVGQRWPRDGYEVVVADNASTDGTRRVVELAAGRADGPRVRYVYVATPGKSIAVNAAIAQASGDVLALTDDDVVPAPDWIAGVCTAFEETGADFVAGRTLPRWEVPPPRWLSPSLYGVLAVADGGHCRFTIDRRTTRIVPVGANLAVRADVIRRIGGFRRDLGKLEGTLRTGEDHELFLRMLHAGYRGVYEPGAVVRHWVGRERLVPGYVRRWLFQNGRDVAQLGTSFPATLPQLFGVPRYLWRDAFQNACQAVGAALRGDRASSFAAVMRVVWVAGFVWQTWFATDAAAPVEIAVGGGL